MSAPDPGEDPATDAKPPELSTGRAYYTLAVLFAVYVFNFIDRSVLSILLQDIKEDLGITVIMVEHDMNLVSQASDRVMALTDGALITIGTPAEVQNHPEVLRAYLGD